MPETDCVAKWRFTATRTKDFEYSLLFNPDEIELSSLKVRYQHIRSSIDFLNDLAALAGGMIGMYERGCNEEWVYPSLHVLLQCSLPVYWTQGEGDLFQYPGISFLQQGAHHLS